MVPGDVGRGNDADGGAGEGALRRGIVGLDRGDHAVARPLLEESAALWRKLGDGRGLAHSLGFLSMEVLGRGEPAAARSLSEESVAILREGEDAFGLALSLALLGKTRNHRSQRGPP
jgi:hypothetical protein